ncbi:HET-domain-containing protein [Zalerion maritima]|uniref:HET-domain-containing protein n=1 Tax=Zalerion maritima TaxID=339359 RepID=A0AAD5RQ86_9PEZI|nr:HET-domain-containing protein [Zalerion maritima]
MVRCPTCGDFQTWFLDGVPLEALRESSSTCAYCKAAVKALSGLPEYSNFSELRLTPSSNGSLGIKCLSRDEDEEKSVHCVFYVPNAPLWAPLNRKDIAADSPERFRMARSWLNHCLDNHSHISTSGKMPRRLISVSGSSKPRLCADVASGPYAALSYCWGNANTCLTTSQTLSKHTRKLPLSSLPRTITDAIEITRNVGIPYLWVDALCIIQDDRQDWAEQSALMGDIYADATVVIAAHASKTAAGGCLSFSETRGYELNRIHIPDLGKDSILSIQEPTLEHSKNPTHFKSQKGSSGDNLASRAWTLQEIELAQRLLHFSGCEMAWECSQSRCCECFPKPHHPQRKWGASTSLRTMRANLEETRYQNWEKDESTLVRELLEEWRRLLSDYTLRCLTVGTDLLPALSGVAATVSRHFPAVFGPEDYLFGLWRRNLVQHLLWFSRSNSCNVMATSYGEKEGLRLLEGIRKLSEQHPARSQASASSSPRAQTPRLYAPTWSWVSRPSGQLEIEFENPLSWSNSSHLYLKIHDCILRASSRSSASQVLNTEARPASLNKFGPGEGKLTVRGPLLPLSSIMQADVARVISKQTYRPVELLHESLRLDQGVNLNGTVYFLVLVETQLVLEGKEALVETADGIPLGVGRESTSRLGATTEVTRKEAGIEEDVEFFSCPSGLILIPSSSHLLPDCFERIGVFNLQSSALPVSRKAPRERTITLV